MSHNHTQPTEMGSRPSGLRFLIRSSAICRRHTSTALDFMAKPTTKYLSCQQIELVFYLLGQKDVTSGDIAHCVCEAFAGECDEVTETDVEAIRDSNFHVSGSNFHVEMSNSGNLILIDVVDELIGLLDTSPNLASIRLGLEKKHAFSISDSDLLDIADGAFHVAGPQTVNFVTKDKYFVPRSSGSEALWMLKNGLSCDFISRYIWYRFHTGLTAGDLRSLCNSSDQDSTRKAGGSSLPPPCLKQTSRRAPPPPPVVTTGLILSRLPSNRQIRAVQLKGNTYTANPAVMCHNNDGTYTMKPGFETESGPIRKSRPSLRQRPWSPELQFKHLHSPSASSEDIDLLTDDVCSRVLMRFQDGHFLVDLEQPDLPAVRLPGPPSSSASDDGLFGSPGMSESDLGPQSNHISHVSPTSHSICSFPDIFDWHHDRDVGSTVVIKGPLPPEPGMNEPCINPLNSLSPATHSDISTDDDLVLHEINPFETELLKQAIDQLPSLGPTTLGGLESEADDDLSSLFSSQEDHSSPNPKPATPSPDLIPHLTDSLASNFVLLTRFLQSGSTRKKLEGDLVSTTPSTIPEESSRKRSVSSCESDAISLEPPQKKRKTLSCCKDEVQ